MNTEEIRELQLEFEKIRRDFKSEFNQINRLRAEFVKDYSVEKIRTFSLDEYVIGKRQPTFCQRIENELNDWGDIHNSAATKFGLYFGKRGKDKNRKFRFTKKFGGNLEIAFFNIKLSIIELIEKSGDIELLKRNLISPMFKGKILSVYYPNKFLNIFSSSHLNYFINMLGLENYSKSELDKQKLLLDFKDSDSVMSEWTIYEFSKFLYSSFGKPNDELKDDNLPEPLRKIKIADFPPIESTNWELVNLETENHTPPDKSTNKKRKYKVDHSKQSRRNKRIGDRGELIVLKMEKEHLIKNGRQDLAEKVIQVSKTDDSAGFDIASYDINGEQKHIEVKSTLRPIGFSQVFISANELKVSKQKNNFYFYLVYLAGSNKPKIWKVKSDQLNNDENIVKTPVLYKLNFKVNNTGYNIKA